MPADVLADLLGITARAIREHAAAGVIPRAGKGLYVVRDALRAYAGHLRGGQRLKSNGDPEIRAARLRLLGAQASREEARVAQSRGELLAAADVEREWSGILRDVRARLLAVPSRLSARLGHLTRTDVETVDSEIRDALSALGGCDG